MSFLAEHTDEDMEIVRGLEPPKDRIFYLDPSQSPFNLLLDSMKPQKPDSRTYTWGTP